MSFAYLHLLACHLNYCEHIDSLSQGSLSWPLNHGGDHTPNLSTTGDSIVGVSGGASTFVIRQFPCDTPRGDGVC